MAQADGWKDIERHVPTGGRLITEDNRLVNVAESFELDIESYSVFNEKRVSNRKVLFSLSSVYPLSVFRDVWTAGVSHTGDEYLIGPGEQLESARLGIYVPGYTANVGVGFRFDYTAGAEAEWGYFDDNDGFLFRYTTLNGLEAVVLRNGSDNEVVDMANFSNDPLDGTGPSGLNFKDNPEQFNDGYVFEIDFTWYGYGPILFKIIDKKVNGRVPRSHIVHVEDIPQNTSIANPNLPIRVKNTGGVGNCHVSGRQYSIIGEVEFPERATGYTVPNLVTVGTSWTPILSFRRKAGEDVYSLATDFIHFLNTGTEPFEYQVLLNSDISGGSIQTPVNRSASETAVEFYTGGVVDTFGEHFFSDIVEGSGVGTSDAANARGNLSKVIPRDYWVTIVAKTLTGSNTDVYAHARVLEQW